MDRIESAILTAIERDSRGMVGREQVDGNAGKNILRTGDYQYAADTASPFFLVERKRNEVPETDRGETSRFRVRVRFQTGKLFDRSRPSLASERNRLRVAFSRESSVTVIIHRETPR